MVVWHRFGRPQLPFRCRPVRSGRCSDEAAGLDSLLQTVRKVSGRCRSIRKLSRTFCRAGDICGRGAYPPPARCYPRPSALAVTTSSASCHHWVWLRTSPHKSPVPSWACRFAGVKAQLPSARPRASENPEKIRWRKSGVSSVFRPKTELTPIFDSGRPFRVQLVGSAPLRTGRP
jgi:hypothetical protein